MKYSANFSAYNGNVKERLEENTSEQSKLKIAVEYDYKHINTHSKFLLTPFINTPALVFLSFCAGYVASTVLLYIVADYFTSCVMSKKCLMVNF